MKVRAAEKREKKGERQGEGESVHRGELGRQSTQWSRWKRGRNRQFALSSFGSPFQLTVSKIFKLTSWREESLSVPCLEAPNFQTK